MVWTQNNMEAVLWILAAVVFMEVFSWAIHKYIMHGVLWKIHKSHHVHTKGVFELNDVFTAFFGGSAIVLILLGLPALDYRFWLGCGITLYGMLYFVLHDVLIHKRLKWFGRPKGKFLRAITDAHRAHHSTKERDDAVSFGLFLVPKRFYRK